MKKRLFFGALLCGLLASTQSIGGSTDAAMLSHTCAGCHGTFGASAGTSMPVIAGQPKAYLVGAMKNYQTGERYSTIMQRLAKGYDDKQIDVMADFFASQPWSSAKEELDPALVEKGKQLHLSKGCVVCHGASGISSMPNAPRLAGQYSEFMVLEMENYLDESKPVPESGAVMRSMLKGSSAQDLKAMAQFYASQE